ncbi:MAG: substrate-binding domain-containing protein [Thermodesulfobacteriota bacterium]|nr:substrate-binding domain-containing protein [Thermodesulfobacteriota bacterium]
MSKIHHITCRLFTCYLLVLLGITLFKPVTECRAQLIIVNSGVEKNAISKNTLCAIFGMRLRTWSDGTPIKVFVLSDLNATHKKFCKRKLNVFPHQLRWNWDRLVFSGIGQAPIEVESEEEMQERIASTPGAIGYLEVPIYDEYTKIKILDIE